MSKIVNVTSGATNLLTSADYSVYSATNKRGSNNATVSKIIITNTSVNTTDIAIDIYSGSETFSVVKGLQIPPKVSFVWEEVFSFNVSTHSLKITNSGAAPGLTVIIN